MILNRLLSARVNTILLKLVFRVKAILNVRDLLSIVTSHLAWSQGLVLIHQDQYRTLGAWHLRG